MNIPSDNPTKLTFHGHTILVVDDNPANLGVVSDYLQEFGFRILVAQNGESALEKAQYAQPNLILLDVMMPGIDGFETCRRLKADETLRDIPVIFMTALLETQNMVAGFQLGAVDYITKPFHVEEVLARVKTHLAIYTMQKQLEVQNTQLQQEIGERKQVEQELKKYQEHLEDLVKERTAELIQANANLKAENAERKQAEESLAEQHRLLRTLIDNMPDVIYVKDVESRFLVANEMLAQLRGITTDKLIGRKDSDFFPPDLAAQYYADEQAIIMTGQALIGREELFIDHTGQTSWILTTKVPFYDNQNRLKGIVGIGRDITRRKEMEQALRQAHDELEERVEQRTAELKRANEQLAALYHVAQIITAPLQLKGVLETITRNTAELLGTDTGVILLLDETGETLTIKSAYGLSQSVVQGTRDRIGEGIAGRVVQTGQPIIANDLPNDPHFYNPSATHEGLLACASVPLIVGGKIIGTLEVHSKVNRFAFDEEHIKTLSLLASQAAIAIENARLYQALQQANDALEERVQQRTAELAQANANLKTEIIERKRAEAETQRRNRNLALLNRIIAASVTETKAEAILEIACHELALAFDLPQATALLLNEPKTQTVMMAEHLAEGQTASLRQIIPVEENLLAQYMLTHKTPLVVDDTQNDPRLDTVRDLLQQRGTVSLLAIPLIIDGEVIGNLGLDTPEPHHFLPEEISLTQRVADQVSGVLARLRLDERRQQLELQYHQSQKMEALGQLTGGVAHDFNNILTVIIGNCYLILNTLDVDHVLRQDVEQILKAAERAASLTRQLLAFSRQQILQPKILNLNNVVANIENMLRRLIGEDIALEIILEPRLKEVKIDPGQIEQVIMNLAVNARDAMPQGGKLTIETANIELDEAYTQQHVDVIPGHYVMLAMSDTGIGMDAKTQTRIFEPFFTTKEQGKGTGLGLATVHGIINQSGGHIWVYSELGRGTTFKIYLLQTQTTAEWVNPKQISLKSYQGTETVLLVEDDDMVRTLARRTLLENGYTVLEAGHGEQARQVYAAHPGIIHLILTDVVIPGGLSGPQLAQELTLLRPKIKALYMSGYTDNAIVHHGVLDPGIAFLPKPFTANDLLRKVREVLDSKTGKTGEVPE